MKTRPPLAIVKPSVRLLLRRSDEKQVASLETQRSVCMKLAAQKAPGWPVVEYVDDGISGSDFAHRDALHRLQAEVQRGDVVIFYDVSRMGRHALHGPSAILSLLEDETGAPKARAFKGATGQEVTMRNAMEILMVVAEGTAAHQEHDNIKTRTTDTLREKAALGACSGGRCYGYTKIPRDGHKWWAIYEPEAAIVRRIVVMFLAGMGAPSIAAVLNEEGIPAPLADKPEKRFKRTRWNKSTIHTMLQNERYSGAWSHGKERFIKSGKRRKVVAPVREPIHVERPEVAIFDAATWEAVAAERARRAAKYPGHKGAGHGKNARHALTGLARCGACGGAMFAKHNTYGRYPRHHIVKTYACYNRYHRGAAVCSSSVKQPIEEVDAALAAYVEANVLNPETVDAIVAAMRKRLEERFAKPVDTAALEGEIATLKAEHKAAVKLAIKLGGDEEVEAQIADRTKRIKALEADLAIARKTPEIQRDAITAMEQEARSMVAEFRQALTEDSKGARRVYEALFPNGLVMTAVDNPVRSGSIRRAKVYFLTGDADVARTVQSGRFTTEKQPDWTVPVHLVALPKAA